jgi:hypothetical protein
MIVSVSKNQFTVDEKVYCLPKRLFDSNDEGSFFDRFRVEQKQNQNITSPLWLWQENEELIEESHI